MLIFHLQVESEWTSIFSLLIHRLVVFSIRAHETVKHVYRHTNNQTKKNITCSLWRRWNDEKRFKFHTCQVRLGERHSVSIQERESDDVTWQISPPSLLEEKRRGSGITPSSPLLPPLCFCCLSAEVWTSRAREQNNYRRTGRREGGGRRSRREGGEENKKEG